MKKEKVHLQRTKDSIRGQGSSYYRSLSLVSVLSSPTVIEDKSLAVPGQGNTPFFKMNGKLSNQFSKSSPNCMLFKAPDYEQVLNQFSKGKVPVII